MRRRAARPLRSRVRLAVIENCFSLVTKVGLAADLGIQVAEVVLSESTILEESDNLIVDVL